MHLHMCLCVYINICVMIYTHMIHFYCVLFCTGHKLAQIASVLWRKYVCERPVWLCPFVCACSR